MSLTLFDLARPAAKAPASPLVGHGIHLRHPQREDVDALLCALEGGYTRPCSVAATGYGKGAMIAEMAGRMRRQQGKVLALVDRANLVHQLADEIERHLDTTCGRVADGVCDGIQRGIVVATIQAMYTPDRQGRPLFRYPQFEDTRAVLIDEGHKFLAPIFRSVADHFADDTGAPIIGFTATPVASSGAAWREFWNWTPTAEGPCMRTTNWCIEQGYLKPARQAFVKASIDIVGLYERLEDLSDDELQAEESDREVAAVLVELLKQQGERKCAEFAEGVRRVLGERIAMIFTPPKPSARNMPPGSPPPEMPCQVLSAWLRAAGMRCEPAWGGRGDLDAVLSRFARGTLQAVTNCALLTEGYNNPLVSAVFICRLIKKWRLTQQIVGRALRPHPAVVASLNELDGPEHAAARRAAIAASPMPDALVVDMVGLDGRVLQASAVDVLFAGESDEARDEMRQILTRRQQAGEGEPQQPDRELLDEARQQIAERQRLAMREAERVRQAAMAGGLDVNVSVSYAGQREAMPDLPAPIELATEGERARFVAYALQYDVERAVAIANSRPRNVLRGMTASFQRKVEAEGKRPDWRRARVAFPNWANEKRRAS